MIKCFWFLKLLKQLFIISLISFFGLLGSSFVNADWIFQEVWTPFTVAWQINYTLNARPSGAWIVEGAGVIVPAFYVPKRWSSYQYYSLFYYNTDWYMVKNSYQSNYPYQSKVYQVVFDSFYLTTPESLSGCSTAFPCGWVSTNYDTYKNNANYKWKMTRFAYYYSSNSNYESSICLIFDSFDSAFCFYNNQNYIGVDWLTTNPAEFDTSLIWTSPRTSSSSINTWNNQVWDWWYLEWINYVWFTWEDLINYFENNPYYKFNKNVCYVWTNDYSTLLSSVYNSWLSLNIWTWWDIFDLYLAKYGNDFTIKQLWSFINTRRSNYWTIFLTNEEDRLYWLEYYDWFVHQFYTDLTINRFLSSPYVFYNLWQITYNFSSQSSVWEEIATYCYYILWYNKDSWWLNIIDNHDSSYDKNALTYKENYLRNNYHFSWWIIVSESWEWTPLDYLDWTWEDNLDFSTFFNKTFNKFKEKASFNPSDLPLVWFLPTYIILFMIAIIFFRFISH